MNPLEVGCIAFVSVSSGALLGMALGAVLPEHHLSAESKDVVKLGMGLIATMAALVLGLLIASAKTSFDTRNSELQHVAADILVLDRVLAHYGPETKDARDLLRRAVEVRLDATWPSDSRPSRVDVPEGTPLVEGMQDEIRALSPPDDAHRWLQSRALAVSADAAQTRWLIFGSSGSSIPAAFLVVLIFWITMIFGSFGLFAPRNATVVGVLLVCALSIAGSLVRILEMDRPLEGSMKISSAPLRYALAHLGE
jgi:hypothetical protein